MRDHKEGKRTEPFFEKNEYNQNVMRIAKQTPKDVAQVAYWHTPEINAENGVSFINKGHIDQNIIDSSIKESLMIADDSGDLSYVDISGKDDYRIKAPAKRVPSEDIAVTNKFYGEFPDIKNALYYRVEIMYHYESTAYGPDEDFLIREYEGSEIAIVDLLGRSMEDKVVHKVYTQAIKGYHFLRKITVLLGDVDRGETVCIRYNHVSSLAQKHEMVAVRNKVELYNSSKNKLTVQGKSKEMMESGLIRIINLRSFMNRVKKEDLENNEQYALQEFTDGKGYILSVLPKVEKDPRDGEIFSYIIEAHYRDRFGMKVVKSTGLLYDHVYNKGSILPNEKNRYRGDGKTIGMIEGMTILDAKEMIHKSLPLGAEMIPDEAVFVIKDGDGNVLYYENSVTENEKIDTLIDPTGFAISINKKESIKWDEGSKPNVLLDEIPHLHRFTIIAEHQVNQWSFMYRIDGHGKVPYIIRREYQWAIRANLNITSEVGRKIVDLNDRDLWESFGEADVLKQVVCATCGNLEPNFIPDCFVPKHIETPQNTKDLWRFERNGLNGSASVSYDGNHEDLIGFYNKRDETGRDLINTLEDYEFSTVVEVKDLADDDAIGIMFRIRDNKSYYMFIWEKDKRNEKPVGTLGLGRVFLGLEGYTHYKFSATLSDYRYSSDMKTYVENMGYGLKHKAILKASPSHLAAYNDTSGPSTGVKLYPDFRYGQTRFPIDKTGTTFEDITLDSGVSVEEVGRKGWEENKKYRVTVQVSGNNFAVYINEGVHSAELGEKVLEGRDPNNTYSRGTYGIMTLSQADVNWSDMTLREFKTDSVTSDIQTTELSSQGKKLLINKKVDVFMEPFISPLFAPGGKYHGSTYMVTSYEGIPHGNISVEVHQNSRNIYGKPLDSDVGKRAYNDWSTMDEDPQLSLIGTGTVTFRPDGSKIIKTDHRTIPDIEIPEKVEQFKWGEPIILDNPNTTVRRKGKTLYFDATQPPIKEVGGVLLVDEQAITMKDNVKDLYKLTDKNIHKLFRISEDIPLNEIALRIEKGHILERSHRSEYPSPEMNYRFRIKQDEVYKLVTDQNKGHEGMNRIRLNQVYTPNSSYINQEFELDVVGWLVKASYKTVPVYAVKIRNDYHIMAHPPRIDGSTDNVDAWLPTITKGKLLKRIVLPEVVDDGKEQIVYERYPQLKQFASTPDKQEEVEAVYSIPEYNRMHFVNRNIQQADKEVPRFITDRILQVKNFNIITDHNEKTPNNRVTAIKSNKRIEIGIKDIDSEKGIFFLHEPLDEENEPLVSYSYEEKDYIYPGFINEKSTLKVTPKKYPIRGKSRVKLKVLAKNEYPLDAPWYVMLEPHSNYLNIRNYGDYLTVRIELRDLHHLDSYKIKLNGETIEHVVDLPFDVKSKEAEEILIPLKKENLNGSSRADIVFVFDVTGSMVQHLSKIRDQLVGFVQRLDDEGIDWRAAMVMYGDSMMGDYNNNRPYRTTVNAIKDDIEEIVDAGPNDFLVNMGDTYPPREQRYWGKWPGRNNKGENTFEAIFDDEYGATSYSERPFAKRHVIVLGDERIHTKENVIEGEAIAKYTLQEGLDLMAGTGFSYYLIYNDSAFFGNEFRAILDDPRIDADGEYVGNPSYNFEKIANIIISNIKLKDENYIINVEVSNKAGISHSGDINIHLTDGGIS